MTSAAIALTVGVAAAVAFLVGWFLRARRTTDAVLPSQQQSLAADAALHESQAETARLHDEVARLRDDLTTNLTSTLDAERARLRETLTAELSAELAATHDDDRQAVRRERQKLDARAQQIGARAHQVQQREALLLRAQDALDALRREADTLQQKARALHGQVQSLHGDARARRDDAERAARDAEHRQAQLTDAEAALAESVASTEAERMRYHSATDEITRRLEGLAGLTRAEAREQLKTELLDEVRTESAAAVKDIRDEAKMRATREAKEIITTAIQRTAAGHAIETTVSVVNISSDEMKGRIIGREGRNIRSFEAATGLEVIVDDTPEAVILSGFDAVRREVGRISLLKLIADGRIHPARIEEVVEKVRSEIEEEIIEVGERTAIDLQIHGLHPDLIRMVGRMRYRTSYGQNLLSHSIETAHLASLMAAELGLDAVRAKRAGLLHDIGKVMEDEIEQPHAIVGMELLTRYKEHADVINAVGAHHDEIEMTAMISPLVQAADAISGARPGARREALDAYVKRLEKLEALAAGFRGVDRVYAIQAGREIRVLVNHDMVSDALAEQLATDISKKIERELQYPGQVKVMVIREVRRVAYAR